MRQFRKATALGKAYVQIRTQKVQGYVSLDVDRAGAGAAWLDAGLPKPTFICISRDSGRAHIDYELAVPVIIDPPGKSARYLAAVERGFVNRLEADPAFAGMLSKNPLSARWDVRIHDRAYELDELSCWLDLADTQYQPRAAIGVGRNCALFDAVRFYAYSVVTTYGSATAFGHDLLQRAQNLNAFASPLSSREVVGIAKSVSNWTWEKRERFIGRKRRGAMGFSIPPVMLAEKRLQLVREHRALAGTRSANLRREQSRAAIAAAVSRLLAASLSVTVSGAAREANVSRTTVQTNRDLLAGGVPKTVQSGLSSHGGSGGPPSATQNPAGAPGNAEQLWGAA